MYGERQFVTRALADGASAYLTKEQAADEDLYRAVRAVCAGRRYLGEALAEQLADHLAADHKGKAHEALSGRELEVFLQREDREHLPDPDPREAVAPVERRDHPVRRPQRPGRLTA